VRGERYENQLFPDGDETSMEGKMQITGLKDLIAGKVYMSSFFYGTVDKQRGAKTLY